MEDILNAVFTAGEKCEAVYDVFNVATRDYVTVREIAIMAAELCGLPLEGVNFEFTGGDRGWKGDVPVVRFDCAKIENLGWHCSRTSGDALRDSMKAMLEEISYA